MPGEETVEAAPARGSGRTVVKCNFRSAGRLSNENARSLAAIHETFARHLATALDACLGTAVEVKLKGIDQLPVREHIAAIAAASYIVPFSMKTMATTMIVESDIDLVFPIIELLLGGRGERSTARRDLSEIEEEIMYEVTSLMARQAENAWHLPSQSLVPSRRIKSSVLHQYCPPSEKLTVVRLNIEVGGTTGSVHLVFPTAFLNVLIQQIKLDHPQKRGTLGSAPRRSIRERMLDCDVELTTEIPALRLPIRDLVGLQPGTVLKLRAPIRAPVMLTAAGEPLFEATPVRNGLRKAAHIGNRTTRPHTEEES